jgi:hypothetical protein
VRQLHRKLALILRRRPAIVSATQQESGRNLATDAHLCKLYAVILEQSLNRLKAGRSKAGETALTKQANSGKRSLAMPGQGKMGE